MSQDDLCNQLILLGLRADAARIYEQMLRTQNSTVEELATGFGWGADAVRSALKELTAWGLVGRHDEGSRLRVVVPDVGLAALVRRRQAEVEQARIAVGHAFETRRSSYRADVDSPVEVVTGPAVKLRIRQMVRGARREIRRLDRPPHLFGPVNRGEIEQLSRGVPYRVVYSRASLEQPGYLTDNIVPCVEAGEQARVAADLPANMTILDDDLAWLARPEDGTAATLTIVYAGGLLEVLIGLFEICWAMAVPLHLATEPTGRIRDEDGRLLSLLHSGVSDGRAAEALGMSRRTFYRRLEQLMARSGSANRFQLAAWAARQGWL